MKKVKGILATLLFTVISIIFVSPIIVVLMNSFKKKTFINLEPFKMPTSKNFVGLENFKEAITKYEFIKAVGWTVFITVGGVVLILVCCSMCAWFITRVQTKITKAIYLLCVFSMVIPFQMVMFTLSGTADSLGLNTPWGLLIIYLGFGAGLAVFMFCGFAIRSREIVICYGLGGLQIPRFDRSNLFLRRISNPSGRLAGVWDDWRGVEFSVHKKVVES